MKAVFDQADTEASKYLRGFALSDGSGWANGEPEVYLNVVIYSSVWDKVDLTVTLMQNQFNTLVANYGVYLIGNPTSEITFDRGEQWLGIYSCVGS